MRRSRFDRISKTLFIRTNIKSCQTYKNNCYVNQEISGFSARKQKLIIQNTFLQLHSIESNRSIYSSLTVFEQWNHLPSSAVSFFFVPFSDIVLRRARREIFLSRFSAEKERTLMKQNSANRIERVRGSVSRRGGTSGKLSERAFFISACVRACVVFLLYRFICFVWQQNSATSNLELHCHCWVGDAVREKIGPTATSPPRPRASSCQGRSGISGWAGRSVSSSRSAVHRSRAPPSCPARSCRACHVSPPEGRPGSPACSRPDCPPEDSRGSAWPGSPRSRCVSPDRNCTVCVCPGRTSTPVLSANVAQ